MSDDVSWIGLDAPGRLGIMAHPLPGSELAAHVGALAGQGVDSIVSLLEPAEAAMLDLADERAAVEAAGLTFRAFPIADGGVPGDELGFWELAEIVRADVAAGRTVVVHCRAGIGRSTLLAAAVLVGTGAKAEDALTRIGRDRGLPVPDTREQATWLVAAAARRGGEARRDGEG